MTVYAISDAVVN